MKEKILITRNGRLGDMVMVAPAVREILRRHPDAEYTLLTSPDGAALFGNYDPRIKHIWLNGTSPLAKRVKWIYFYFKIKNSGFKYVYSLDSDWKIRSLLKKSAPGLVRPDLPVYEDVVHAALLALHMVDVNSDSLSDIEIPFIPVDLSASTKIKSLLLEHGISDNDILIGLNPSFSGLKRPKTRQYKLWSPRHWAKLNDMLHEYGNKNGLHIKIAIYSLPNDLYIAKDIYNLCKYPPSLLVPKRDLELFKAYLERLDLYIGPDTGATHLAAAVGSKVVALFSINNPYDCGPVVKNMQESVIRAEDIGGEESLLDSINPEHVFSLAVRKLEKSGN